jgi:AAA+ ATPase superfamily predicted ATPase
MRFYNREKEMALLEELNGVKPSFLVILGRRRVGKTELIRRFIDGKRSLYLYVDDRKGKDLLLSEFTAYVRSQLGLPDYITFDTFDSLFEFLLVEAGDMVVAIDEFQRFETIDPSIVTALQDLWDRLGRESGAFLIASGSSIGMMHRIFLEKGAPLFKRADNVVTLRPFGLASVFEVLDGMGVNGVGAKVDLHCLFGGMVYYYILMERYKAKSLTTALGRLVLDDLAPLRNDVRDILVEGFGRKHATYFEILAAIAEGRSTKSEIGDVVHVKATSLSPYLNDLREILHLVEHTVPILDDPRRSKKGRYVLKDNFFRFYFRFIFPNSSLYEIGAYDRLHEIIAAGWGDHKGKAFESEVRACLSPHLSMEFSQVGSFWDRKGTEIDLVGLNHKEREMLLVEIKARKLTRAKARRVLRDQEAKVPLIPYEAKKVNLGLAAIAVEGKADLEAEGYRVWELEDILKASRGSHLNS